MAPQSRRGKVAAALALGPGTVADLAKLTGLAYNTVWRWVKEMHAQGECHITPAWKRTPGGGAFVPTYAAGPGVDAPCRLKPYTQAQLSTRYRKKKRKDGSWQELLALNRARWAAKRASYKKDPLLAALYKPKTTE